MSNAIRYDALLVRDLAAELHRSLAGLRLHSLFLDRDSLTCTLRTRAPRRGESAPSLLWQLHPQSGHLTAAPDDDRRTGGVLLAGQTAIERVHAPPDERVVLFELAAGDAAAGAARLLVVELVTNQWNALAVGDDGRITAVLRERETAGRRLRAGAPWALPARTGRAGAEHALSREEWHGLVGGAPPGERLRALVRNVAWTSPLNAAEILGSADVSADPAALDAAWRRYLDLVWSTDRTPVLRLMDGCWQPYTADRAAAADDAAPATLLDAFETAAERAAAIPAESADTERALAAVTARIDALDRRAERLRAQQQNAAAQAAELRRHADLLLAQLHRVERGAAAARLDDFEGGTVEVALDAALSGTANAKAMYDSARRRDRAAHRIPALLRAAARERQRAEQLLSRVRDGSVDAGELSHLLSTRAAAPTDAAALPYREYRTSGGLEVRVGRGSRANDELTFRRSRPHDIWLHARDVAGAHVILRWERTDENPPAAAIAEAAALAALHSRARTSGTVAVDWTRRKYVRKPRKAAPGLVVPERVKTVFVEPDAALERRLRATAWTETDNTAGAQPRRDQA